MIDATKNIQSVQLKLKQLSAEIDDSISSDARHTLSKAMMFASDALEELSRASTKYEYYERELPTVLGQRDEAMRILRENGLAK